MTEQDWLACSDPKAMVEFVRKSGSDRKKLLFAVACCRRIRPLTADGRSTMAVEVAERFADGLANRQECKAAGAAALAALEAAERFAGFEFEVEEGNEKRWAEFNAAFAAETVVNRGGHDPWDSAVTCAHAIEFLTGTPTDAEHVAQVAFVLDTFGNPFRPPPTDRDWFVWQGGTVPKLAASAYDERLLPSGHLDTARLRILADALEEAGCADQDILDHLRGPGTHFRGCWCVDLILGRE